MGKNQGDGVKETRFSGETQYNTPRAQGGTEGIGDRVTGNQDSTLDSLSGEYGMQFMCQFPAAIQLIIFPHIGNMRQ